MPKRCQTQLSPRLAPEARQPPAKARRGDHPPVRGGDGYQRQVAPLIDSCGSPQENDLEEDF
jgi:hypothetical protein